ncbi:MAG: hypothetical protein LBR73_04990 [Oscillospiraceae bacterium]|nr:hypothetical protein [Oscillospiraceae bacterium]
MKHRRLLAALLVVSMLITFGVNVSAHPLTDTPRDILTAVVQQAAAAVGDAWDTLTLSWDTLFSPRGFWIALDHTVTRLITAVLAGIESIIPAARPMETTENYDGSGFLEGRTGAGRTFYLGYDSRSILPADFGERGYRMGGFTFNKIATETYDDLKVRTFVLDDGSGNGAVSFSVLDCIGFANADARLIRAALKDMTDSGQIASLNVSSTHTHSGIDSQGLWGHDIFELLATNMGAAWLPGIIQPVQGVDPTFLQTIIDQTEASVRAAYANLEPGTLSYSKTEAQNWFSDRLDPYIILEEVHRLTFSPSNKSHTGTIIANFSAHPEKVGAETSDNPGNVVSGDFVPYIEETVNRAGYNFVFLQGAIGTRISANTGFTNDDGQPRNRLQQTIRYGNKMGELLLGMDAGESIEPTLSISHKQFLLEVTNPILKAVGKMWLADNKMIRQPWTNKTFTLTEVGYLQLGDTVKALLQPGETSPELVVGGPNLTAAGSVTGRDYPLAPLRASVDENLLVFDLMNDSIGYIIADSDSTDLLIRYNADGTLTDESTVNGNLNDALLLSFSPKVASTVGREFLALVQGADAS